MARNQPEVSGRSVHASVSLWLCASVHVYESMCDYDCVHVCARTCIRVSVGEGSDGRQEHKVSRKERKVMREQGSELHHTRDKRGASTRGPSRGTERREAPGRVRPLRGRHTPL